MKGSKRISELITDKNALKAGRINIIEAPVSSGKTYFALDVIPKWASNPEKVLYLIDTTNGELSIQRNIIAVSRNTYALWDYNTKHIWGETDNDEKMPVMTYAGFGKEVQTHDGKFHWLSDFEYIICDEMQSLVNYSNFKSEDKRNIIAAEVALRMIAAEGKTKIVALSATPQKIRERFGSLCYDVPFDRTDVQRLETFAEIPYSSSVEDILLRHKGQTGILFTITIEGMKKYMDFANQNGIRANGFWSTNAGERMGQDQLSLRDTVLENETIPADVDLLVINASSQTCIKIQGKKRKVDYIIVHDKNDEVKTQVRGRYHGDLPVFYYHDIEAANTFTAKHIELPERFLNVRLYSDQWNELCQFVGLNRPHGGFYSMPTTAKYLGENGYCVIKKKDSKRKGQYYYVISVRDTNSGKLIY